MPLIITVPPGHPVCRWDCPVTGCERPKMGHGDLCSAHLELWREARQNGEMKAGFLRRPTGRAGRLDLRAAVPHLPAAPRAQRRLGLVRQAPVPLVPAP